MGLTMKTPAQRVRPLRHALAGTIFALLALAGGVQAQEAMRTLEYAAPFPAMNELWVCTDRSSIDQARPPLEFSLKEGLLIEQPLGTPRYGLLVNNDHAVIGVDSYGDFDPVLGLVSIFVSTVMIDRATGSFTTTMSVADKAPEHRTGHCRRFEEIATAGSTAAQRN
jgi:hypothetical protein